MTNTTIKEIAMIAAWAKDARIIGYNGSIPWHIPADMEQYKALTKDATLIMGRKTYFSIRPKFRPLAGRENIVVSSTLTNNELSEKDSSIIIVRTIEEALQKATREKVFFNGGEKIYQEGMRYATKIYGTIVDYRGPGDTFFPEIGPEWKNKRQISIHDFSMGQESTHPHAFVILEK